MAAIQHLRNAPIVEALVDVRVEARPELQGQDFLPLREALRTDFPTARVRKGLTIEGVFGGEETQQSLQDHGVNGLFLHTDDEKLVAQFRTDGFTLNRLAPYTSWAVIEPRALELLKTYFDIARPRAVTRVATRYINRLQLPSSQLNEFLTSPPRDVPGTAGVLEGFMEVQTLTERSGAKVQYSQILDATASRVDSSSVIIDIDAFWVEAFEPDVPEVRDRLSTLHELKNRVFFGALTERAVRLFV